MQLALWIDPLKEGGPAEAVKYLDAHRDITGLKFHPTGDKWQITEKIAGPYLDIAMERDLFVITHTQPTEGQHAICYYELLKKRPELRFIVGHSSTIEESIFLSACFKNCYLDPSWLGFSSFFFELAGRQGGHKKILAGTDGTAWYRDFEGDPFEDMIQMARQRLPSMKEVHMFCYDNAAEFFRL